MEQLAINENGSAATDLVTFTKLAERFQPIGVPASWLRRLANDGTLPCLRLGPRVLYDVNAVQEKLREMASQSSPAQARKPRPRRPRLAAEAEVQAKAAAK